MNKVRIYTRLNPTETVLGIANAAVARLHQGRVTIEVGPAFLYHDDVVHELPEGLSPGLTALVTAPKPEARPIRVPLDVKLPLFVTAALLVVLGVWPSLLLQVFAVR